MSYQATTDKSDDKLDKSGYSDGCLIYGDLTEKSYSAEQLTGKPGVPAPGASGIYKNNITDSAGNQVGTVSGYSVELYYRQSDHHLMAYYEETVTLPQGEIHDSGIVDFTELASGAWVKFKAVGTSGELLGKVGYREWRLIGKPGAHVVEVKMSLCDPPPIDLP
jgi:hypothetical protein